jgi:hypothetical protein
VENIVFTRVCQWPVFWVSWIQPISSHFIYPRSILILFHLCTGLPRGVFPSGLPTRSVRSFVMSSKHATYATYLFVHGFIYAIIFVKLQNWWSSLLRKCFYPPVTPPPPIRSKYSPQLTVPEHLESMYFLYGDTDESKGLAFPWNMSGSKSQRNKSPHIAILRCLRCHM